MTTITVKAEEYQALRDYAEAKLIEEAGKCNTNYEFKSICELAELINIDLTKLYNAFDGAAITSAEDFIQNPCLESWIKTFGGK